jgi:hypothetical protein
MSIQILDGKGRGNLASVNEENQLATVAVARGPLEDAAAEGEAAFFVSTFATGTTNIEVIYIQNTETDLPLHITRLQLASSVDTIWTLFEVTSATAAGGTALTVQNPQLSSGVARSNNSFGNASVTGTLTGNNLGIWSSLAKVTEHTFLEGSLILGNQDAVAITASTDGTVYVNVQGFWGTER